MNDEIIRNDCTYIEDTDISEPEVEFKLGKIANCKKVNVRAEANKDSKVLRVLEAGAEVMIDETNSTDEFYNVYTECGIEGFCMKQFITINR